MKKYAFIMLIIREGEREYFSPHVRELPKGMTPEQYADNEAKNWHDWEEDEEGEPEEPILTNGEYFHCLGEVAVSVEKALEITKEEFEVMQKFLI